MTTPFEWTLVEAIDPVTNISRPKVVLSDLGNDETYQSVYYWFTSIIFVLLPLALLIIFNSFLIQSVRQSQNLRRTMTRQTSESEDRAAHNEIRITVTLIAVVMMFLICQLPTAATLIYKIFQASGSDADEEALLLGLGNIFNFLVTINAACNFLLYCALSDKYRRTFMLTFCRCFIRSASPTQSMAIYTQYAPTSPDASEGHSFVQHSPRHSTSNRGLMPSRNVDNHRQSSVRTNSTYLALPGNRQLCSCISIDNRSLASR
jgi:Serpentine type 7TM GPCR chemoreceptor Srw